MPDLPVPSPDPQDPLREALERIAFMGCERDGPAGRLHFCPASIARDALAAPRPDRLSADEREMVERVRRLPDNALTYEPRLLALIDRAFPPDPPEEN